MKAKAFGLAACLAFGGGAPAEAQFMTNYPVLVVPPPQAQTLVMPPKPNPKPAPPKPDASAESPPTPNSPPGCYYQGRTRICP
jgi:hypothetical protein